MDVAGIGFLDRSGSSLVPGDSMSLRLRQLTAATGMDLACTPASVFACETAPQPVFEADWEQEELIRRCDTGRNGLCAAQWLAKGLLRWRVERC